MASGGFGGNSEIRSDDKPAQDDSPAYVLDRPSTVQKTPISYLQEMCTKRTLKPEYELLSTEGQVHEPTFMYRVTVNDLSAVGQGKSKKTAKHLAAKNLLERIVSVGRYKDFGIGETQEEAMETLRQLADTTVGVAPARLSGGSGGDDTTQAVAAVPPSGASTGSDETDGDGAGNPVGRLQELCQKKKWPAPAYELTSEDGMPHERIFVIQITLGKFSADGSGRSKKIAKREAAEKLLKFLDKMPPEAQRENIGISEEDELAETGGSEAIVQQPFAELDEHLSNLAITENTAVIRSVAEEEKCGMKKLAELDLTKETAGAKHVHLLKLIGEEENWEHEFYPLPRRSKSGDYQCLVQLNAMPVGVCYGRGASADEAKESAAYNALEYLKLMTKKEPALQ